MTSWSLKVRGNLNLGDEISETPLSLEEKIAKNSVGLNRWDNSIIVIHWWNLSIDCLRLQHRSSHNRHHHLHLFLRLLFPPPRLSWSSLRPFRQASSTSYPDLSPNPKLYNKPKKKPVPPSSNTISRFICRKMGTQHLHPQKYPSKDVTSFRT